MRIENVNYLKAYAQRKLGNLKNPYRVYEYIIDEITEEGAILIININTFDYQIIRSKINIINLLQEEDIPNIYIELLKKERLR